MKSTWGNLSIGLLIFGVIALSVLTFLFVLDVSSWIMRDDIADTLAFGQLCFDALVLPTAAIGFIIAVREIRKAQRAPKLDLRWQHWMKGLTTSIDTYDLHEPDDGHDFGKVVLVNEGSSIAIWYLVQMEIPTEILLHQKVMINGEEEYFVSDETWRAIVGEAGGTWVVDRPIGKLILRFMSMGAVASFPGHPLPICEIYFETYLRSGKSEEIKIPYKIVTDHGEASSGQLTIRMHPIT